MHFSWELLDAEADARTASPAQREAARLQGRLLLRVARRLWPSPVLDELAQEIPSPHHPIALGAAAHAAGATPGDAALAAAYHAITGPATAAVRLLGLDPVAVHGILADLTPDLTALTEPARTKFPKPNGTARHEPDAAEAVKQADAGLPEPRGIGATQLSEAGLHERGGIGTFQPSTAGLYESDGFGAAEVDGVEVPEVDGCAARGGCGCSGLAGYSADPGAEEGGWAALGAPSAPGLDLLAERHAHATVRLFVS
ncbi:urease accessory UreF family protein [Nonomuraea sp. C10]|uniref:urease accessory UreF family protein n=1 Tax=Nonomuraea sp. C10 TaxID=2600577 RepID=UPI0021C3E197|nr:urease accessory UreF family protein [Nonomuraea sp. C10]